MVLEEKSEYILIVPDENSFQDFLRNFEDNYDVLKEKHLIIKVFNNFNIVEKNILLFLKYSKLHQQNGMTFVIVYPNVDIDEFPEYFNVVPTLQEAKDILEMENIQRDLGF